MVDISKEGYVAISNNKIPLVNYLFYLTYNHRASVFNKFKDIDFSSKNLYKINSQYEEKLRNSSTRKKGVELGEFVVSFSPELCTLAIKHKFKNNIDSFKKSFLNAILKILKKNLEHQEFSVFIHEYDSTQMRVHAHILFYPYLPTKEVKMKNIPNLAITPLKMWIDEPRLEMIKKDFNEYAQHIYKGLEGKDANVATFDFETSDLLKLIELDETIKSERMDKSSLEDTWSESRVIKLKEVMSYLEGTKADKTLDKKYDYSILIDYLYDFQDEDVYRLLFEHSAIENILKTFSLYKSKPKFSSVFIKLMTINKEDKILNIVKKKLSNKKSEELKNILINRYVGDSFVSGNNMTRKKDQAPTQK